MPSPNHHLLNTSWTLHRLSPLHHGKEFQSLLDNPVALKTYATRFRDQLTGNAFPGVVSSTEDDSLSRTGALKDCVWEILPHLSLLDDSPPTLSNPDSGVLSAGIAVTLEYENITYKAALLMPVSGDGMSLSSPTLAGEGPPSSSDRRKGKGKGRVSIGADGSTHLPLLMTRFPTPLRQTFVSFLSANFDTYVSNLRLSSTFMCSALEIYLGVLDSSLDERDHDHGREEARAQLLEYLAKELQITVAFSSAVAPELRSLNVSVPRKALGGILLSVDDSGPGAGSGSSSVLKGLSDYIHRHLAMDLDLAGTSENSALVKQHVRVSKIACAAFNIAGEGRVKLVGQSLAGATAGEEDEEGDAGGGGGDDDVSSRRRVGLRANEALLHAIVRRAAVSGENQAS